MVREACVTVAYMSQELHHKVDHLCETLLPSLINLIPNSAKVSVICNMLMYTISKFSTVSEYPRGPINMDARAFTVYCHSCSFVFSVFSYVHAT